MSFKGKVVIVTGAGSGIGAAIAIKFYEEGANVVMVDKNQDTLKSVADKCGKPIAITADVTKDADCKGVIKKAVDKYGNIDVLVNNAGILRMSSIVAPDNALQVFDEVMNNNLRSAVCLTYLAAPYLIEAKGSIINISSIAGIRAVKEFSAYNVSKAALDHFTRSIALDLLDSGVRANSVNLGLVNTNLLKNSGLQGDFKRWDTYEKRVGVNSISEPEEIAAVVLFLASAKAVGITGSSLTNDNGALLKI